MPNGIFYSSGKTSGLNDGDIAISEKSSQNRKSHSAVIEGFGFGNQVFGESDHGMSGLSFNDNRK